MCLFFNKVKELKRYKTVYKIMCLNEDGLLYSSMIDNPIPFILGKESIDNTQVSISPNIYNFDSDDDPRKEIKKIFEGGAYHYFTNRLWAKMNLSLFFKGDNAVIVKCKASGTTYSLKKNLIMFKYILLGILDIIYTISNKNECGASSRLEALRWALITPASIYNHMFSGASTKLIPIKIISKIKE